jgi:hypothetical protein
MFLKIGRVKGNCGFYSQLIGAESEAPGAEINSQV